MTNVAKIHRLKLLHDVQEVILSDILETIKIINERIDVPATPYKYENMIELESIVTGFEGYYGLVSVAIFLNESMQAVVRIEDIFDTRNVYEMTLNGLDINHLVELKEESARSYKKNAQLIIKNMIQSERMDIDDIVTDVFENAYSKYEIGGVYKRTSPGLL